MNYFVEKANLLMEVCQNPDFMGVVQSIDWLRFRKTFLDWVIDSGGLEQAIIEAGQSFVGLGYMDDQFASAFDEENLQKSCFHFAVYKSLLGALLKSGTGKSCDEAMYVISTSDEYFFLRNVKKLKTLNQSLVEKDGRNYDVVQTVSRDGDESTWYFDVTEAMNIF